MFILDALESSLLVFVFLTVALFYLLSILQQVLSAQAAEEDSEGESYLTDPDYILAMIEVEEFLLQNSRRFEKLEISPPESCPIVVGSKWNYDRSLDHATWIPPLVVREVIHFEDDKYGIVFDQPTPYKIYGSKYFGSDSSFPFTPYKEKQKSEIS